MSSKSVLILLGFLAGLAASFEIKTFRPKSLVVDEGASIELYCQVDGYYEWCTFKRLNDGKICDFEWKREKWDVDILQCSDFAGRMTRTGRLKGLSLIFWKLFYSAIHLVLFRIPFCQNYVLAVLRNC
jgi:hypothetical protein